MLQRLDFWITLFTITALIAYWLRDSVRPWLLVHLKGSAGPQAERPRRLTTSVPAAAAAAAAAVPTTPPPGAATGMVRRAPWLVWRPIVQSEYPHVAIKGPTNAGKTLLAQALVADRSGLVVVIDPNWEPGAWGGLPVVTTDDDDNYAPIEAVLQALLQEMKRRVVARRRGEPAPPLLTIAWDEIPDCMEECKTAGEVLRRLLRRARKYNMRLIALSQSNRVKAWGVAGHGDALDNLVWIHLGDAATDLIPELARTVHPAVLDYRGNLIPIDTSEAPRLAKLELGPNRVWHRPEPATAPTDDLVPDEQAAPAGPEWTTEHIQVAAWITAEPQIKHREIARRLWGGDGGGRAGVKAGELRKQVESVPLVACSAVPSVGTATNQPTGNDGTEDQPAETVDTVLAFRPAPPDAVDTDRLQEELVLAA